MNEFILGFVFGGIVAAFIVDIYRDLQGCERRCERQPKTPLLETDAFQEYKKEEMKRLDSMEKEYRHFIKRRI